MVCNVRTEEGPLVVFWDFADPTSFGQSWKDAEEQVNGPLIKAALRTCHLSQESTGQSLACLKRGEWDAEGWSLEDPKLKLPGKGSAFLSCTPSL